MVDGTRQAGREGGEAPRVLLIDDDRELGDLLGEFFAEQGIRLEFAADGRRGLGLALAGRHDLVLLDVMMPGLDGFELLRLVRRQSEVPVIMLTARSAKSDRLAGLDSGADDYVPKPFDPDELLARVRAVLRRVERSPAVPDRLEAEEVRLVPTAREAWCDGAAVPVTAIEYDILEILVRAAGRVVTRDELTSALYHRPVLPFDRALDVHVGRLRKKLGAYGDRVLTVRGVGFLFRVGPRDEEAR